MLPPALPGLLLSSALAVAPPAEEAPAEVAAPVAEPLGPPVLPDTPDGSRPEAPEGPEVAPTPEPEVAPAPEPAPVVAPALPPGPFDVAPGLASTADQDWVAIRPPEWNGTGQFIGAGVSFALGVALQAGDSLLCGDCASGVLERAFFATSMGLAAGGGISRGHADAYDDTALRRPRRDTRRLLIAGATLTGVGAVLGLANEGMWWRCVFNGRGPYALDNGNFFAAHDCRYGISRGMLDLASGSVAAGLGMLTWSLVYRRDSRAYERARVIGLAPSVGRERAGFTVQGRF